MNLPKYDLHAHTTASDGTLSPQSLLDMANINDIKVFAFTDHDTVEGIKAVLARPSDVKRGMQLITGAELTCVLDKQILHVVALGVDLHHPELEKHLLKLKSLRMDRAVRIAAKLEKKKLPNILELVLEKAGSAQIGRPHFAKVLCDLKIVTSEKAAFKKYLGAGKVANVSVQWPDLEEVLEVISISGGLSVLAHPTKYNLTMSKLRRVIAAFKILGGDAIELSYPGINKEQQNILKYEIDQHQLLVSAGSDFHTPENTWTKLGCYPNLPENMPHVLDKLLDGSASNTANVYSI